MVSLKEKKKKGKKRKDLLGSRVKREPRETTRRLRPEDERILGNESTRRASPRWVRAAHHAARGGKGLPGTVSALRSNNRSALTTAASQTHGV